MSNKEATKINTPKMLKELTEKNNRKSDELIPLESSAIQDIPENITTETADILEGGQEKTKSFFEKKVLGALTELFRRKKLDETVEINLSAGLENNQKFVAADNKINKKRNWLIAKINNLLNIKEKNTQQPPYVFDEIAQAAMKELEAELTDPFAKTIYSKLGEINKRLLLDYLVDNQVDQDISKIIDLPSVSEANNNVVAFSDNGYLVQQNTLNNETKQEVDVIDIDAGKTLYNLISPEGKTLVHKVDYDSAIMLLEEQAENYQQKLKEEFLLIPEFDLELEPEASAESELESDSQSQKNDTEPVLVVDNVTEPINPEPAFANPFNEKISKYAESIGIKPEELSTNTEFLALTPEQQQFTLETLRRTSLAKATVAGHENFVEEKSSKKWWQKIGFNMNQVYHKERHKIEAIKNIEKEGLVGYGEEDFKWLVDIIKHGPEIKMNDQGDVLVDFLKETDFKEEDQIMITEYNDIARDYIEYTPKKGEPDPRGSMASKLDDICREFLNKAGDREQTLSLNELFLKSRNNIELLRFLSADKDTEIALNKLANTSVDGIDRLKGMVSGQKDKAGYSALGFVIRSGSKFALANSAVLAGALSYTVAPMAAAIVGAVRGYNTGKKELNEKEELAKLGVEDQSGLVRGKNLAVGHKENEEHNINFGLKEKLEELTLKSKNSNLSYDEYHVIMDKLMVRINYTELKISRDEIDYGSVQERNVNYSNLINALSEAKTAVGLGRFYNLHRQHKIIYSAFEQNGYSAFAGVNSYNGKIEIPNRLETESVEDYQKRLSEDKNFVKYQTWATDKKRLEKLSEAGLELRLNSFLKTQESKQNKKEEKYLLKKAVSGALMGASFAAAGAFVAEHLGINNLFNKNLDTGTVKGNNNVSNVVARNNSTETLINTDKSTVVTGKNINSEMITANEPTSKIAAETKTYVDEISSKGLNGKSDSVWRSTREIFKNNSQELGYRGDLNNKTALNNWAESQTAKAIGHSGDVTDKVFEGNKIELIKDGDHFKVNVNQDSGFKPGNLEHLNHQINPKPIVSKTEVDNLMVKDSSLPDHNLNAVADHDLIDHTNGGFENINSDQISGSDIAGSGSGGAENIATHVYTAQETALVIKELHLNPEHLIQRDGHFSYQGKGYEEITFSLKNGNHISINSFYDKTGNHIPANFFKELRGNIPIGKFIGRHFDKIFTSWDKLSVNDQTIYKNLNLFERNTLAPSALLNKIGEIYHVDASQAYVYPAKNQILLENGQHFDMTLKGIKKLAAFLAKK